MMWLLTSDNDAILVVLTFMLPLAFDSNLRRYSFAFCELELLANNFSLAAFTTNIRCISNVGLEALRILFYSYWCFFRLEVCVYYYSMFYLGYLSSLSRPSNGI